jgi:hypothetical protein
MNIRIAAQISALITFALLMLSPGAATAQSAPNFLKMQHEQRLLKWMRMAEQSPLPGEKSEALGWQAGAMDSLGMSKEALIVVDRAIFLADSSDKESLIVTKAKILFSLDAHQNALALLEPIMIRAREAARRGGGRQALGNHTEAFITAAFAYMSRDRWADAVAALADAESPGDDSFNAYKGLVYRYVRSRTDDKAATNDILDGYARSYAKGDNGHYGALLSLWNGEGTPREVVQAVEKLSGAEKQEALSESLFYIGAFRKFVQNDAVQASTALHNLNQIAAYGSIEWIYGRRVLR